MAAYAWRALGCALQDQGETAVGQAALTEACRQFEALGLTAELDKTKALLA